MTENFEEKNYFTSRVNICWFEHISLYICYTTGLNTSSYNLQGSRAFVGIV